MPYLESIPSLNIIGFNPRWLKSHKSIKKLTKLN